MPRDRLTSLQWIYWEAYVRASAEIDRRFLTFVTDLLLCSRCLKHGVRTPVRQVISPRHRPRPLCRDCRLPAARD
jgi:hypothetical protein